MLKQNQASYKTPKLRRRITQQSSFTFYTDSRFQPTFGSKRFLRKPKSWIFLSRVWQTRAYRPLMHKPYNKANTGKNSFFFFFKKNNDMQFETDRFQYVHESMDFWQKQWVHTQFIHHYSPLSVFSSSIATDTSLSSIRTPIFTPLQLVPNYNHHPLLVEPNNRPWLQFNYLALTKLTQLDLLVYEENYKSLIHRTAVFKMRYPQKLIYARTRYYKALRNRLIGINIVSKRSQNKFHVIHSHQLSSDLLRNVVNREQVPPFNEIPRSKIHNINNFTGNFSLSRLLMSHEKRPLRRAYGHLTPFANFSLASWKSPSLYPQLYARKKVKKRLLTIRVLRQFITKRLFRPTPVKTYFRKIRRIRKCWTRLHVSNIQREMKKAEGIKAHLAYEKALFEEMLSTPEGEEGPLLKTFLYTGFEEMPLLNQKYGNTLFKKNRKLRPGKLLKKSPNRGLRKFISRERLRSDTLWGKNASRFKYILRLNRDRSISKTAFFSTPTLVRRRRRNGIRYWPKRMAYFSRHSFVRKRFKRLYFRFKRKARLGRRRMSRNLRFKKKFNLEENTKKKIRNNFRPRRPSRPRRRKKARFKLKKEKLKYKHLYVQALRFRFLTKLEKENCRLFSIPSWRRNKKRKKPFRLYLKPKKRLKVILNKIYPHVNNLEIYLAPQELRTNTLFPNKLVSNSELVDPQLKSRSTTASLNLILKFWKSDYFLKYIFLRHLWNDYFYSVDQLIAKFPITAQHFTLSLQNQINAYCFGTKTHSLRHSNVWTCSSSQFTLRKKILRSISQMSFRSDTGAWAHKCLIQFAENISGRKVALQIGPFIDQALTVEDQARCYLWETRATGFRKILGHRIFTSEALMILTASIRLKDPTLLSNWIRAMLGRMSFWKYKVLFRYLKFLVQHLFKFSFSELDFRGFKLRLKGKISVGGNSRSRVLFYRIGDTSHSKMSNRVAYDLSYIKTFTGVLGFKLWFFY